MVGGHTIAHRRMGGLMYGMFEIVLVLLAIICFQSAYIAWRATLVNDLKNEIRRLKGDKEGNPE